MRPIGHPDTASHYWCELWQSNREVTRWRRVRGETVSFAGAEDHYVRWPWEDEPNTRRWTTHSVDEGRAWDWMGPPDAQPLDMPVPRTTDDEGSDWRFLPFASEPRHGLAFRSGGDSVMGPYYFVDLDRRTLKQVPGDDRSCCSRPFTEACGRLLLPGIAGSPRVIDCSTGEVEFTQTWNSDGAVWVPIPR